MKPGDWVEAVVTTNNQDKNYFYHGQLIEMGDSFVTMADIYEGELKIPVTNLLRFRKMGRVEVRLYLADKRILNSPILNEIREDYEKLGIFKPRKESPFKVDTDNP